MCMSSRSIPKKCFILYGLGTIFLIGGIIVGSWHISGLSRRSDIRAHGQRTTGMAVSRDRVQYKTPEGEMTGEPLIGVQQGTLTRFESIVILYDKDKPHDFILDQNETPYDATMWIAVAKLVGAGLVSLGAGYFYQRRSRKAASKNL